MYTLAISQFIAMILNAGNTEEIIGVLYLMIGVFNAIFKICNMWKYRKNLADVINTLTKEPFRPEIAGEIKIRQNFDKMIR